MDSNASVYIKDCSEDSDNEGSSRISVPSFANSAFFPSRAFCNPMERKSDTACSLVATNANRILKYATKGKPSVTSLSLINSGCSQQPRQSLSSKIKPVTKPIIQQTARCLDLRNSQLSEFPVELLQVPFLQSLRLDYNHIYSIPSDIDQLIELEILSLSHNELKSLDRSLGGLKKLKALTLDNNKLDSWPEWICTELSFLRLLYMHGNGGIPGIPLKFAEMTLLERFSFDWLTYVQPEVGAVVKGVEGKKLISEIRGWCQKLSKGKQKYGRFLQFYQNFAMNKKGKPKLENSYKIYPKKRSLLHVACRLGHNKVISELLEAKYAINLKDSEDSTPFSLAIVHNKIECARILLKSPLIDVNIGQNDTTPLHTAIRNGRYDLAESIVIHPSINIMAKDSNGNTALHLLFDRFDSYPLLIQHVCDKIMSHPKVDLNSMNDLNCTPLHVAAMYRQRHALIFASEHNRKVTVGQSAPTDKLFDFLRIGGKEGLTVLHEICSHVDVDTLSKVLKQDLNVLKRDSMGRTARELVKDALAAKLLIKKEKEIILERLKGPPSWKKAANTCAGPIKMDPKEETQKIKYSPEEKNIRNFVDKRTSNPPSMFKLTERKSNFQYRKDLFSYLNKNGKSATEEDIDILEKELDVTIQEPGFKTLPEEEEECNVAEDYCAERKTVSFFYRPTTFVKKSIQGKSETELKAITASIMDERILLQNKHAKLYKFVVEKRLTRWKRYKILYNLFRNKSKDSQEIMRLILRKLPEKDPIKTELVYLIRTKETYNKSLELKSVSNGTRNLPAMRKDLTDPFQQPLNSDHKYSVVHRPTNSLREVTCKTQFSNYPAAKPKPKKVEFGNISVPLFRTKKTIDYFNKIHL